MTSTQPYDEASDSNKHLRYMHLTNFSLNKSNVQHFSESADANDATTGSKRRVGVFFDFLQREGYDMERVWVQIEGIAAKAALAVQPVLQHYYRLSKPHDKFGDRSFPLSQVCVAVSFTVSCSALVPTQCPLRYLTCVPTLSFNLIHFHPKGSELRIESMQRRPWVAVGCSRVQWVAQGRSGVQWGAVGRSGVQWGAEGHNGLLCVF